ncbi:YqaE/Pmp3 family membrane protein [Sphingomonas sp. R1]|uniref:YqaE/Pmp3 family membrane protein n=1 Tax=Sphingomonas sp. R1 TaxID=399176 RepID=UPI0022247D4D|nr:YqaE/Pmp3 family membrane protein [Sphingomonas sp. R1]UYY76715.1 YqaE/Pmp3 family membrane protein [Sphingomonas sp. R1]
MTRRPARLAAAALLPPLGVYLEEGAGRPFQLACGLTVLGFLPGAGYALWRLLRRRGTVAA